ncbi:nuclear transport factor 2 family protein [Pseudomaricurvus sp. HS19]|uniref:nuclear transport factor 2 family protein n=1 Tax=Pseudomaricurvus sp. HS19 TaxID=2692626 RepID=UPI0013691B48|nr:nuclear transport factor 2 family protein [Pseudomaricurvus sp. HS19]MYM63374.1 nuclear transport factor 2 family protein [Pseudomaricurvus sp. HS19]
MDDKALITTLVEQYFYGLHYGEADVLSALFHPDCVLKAPGLRRDLSQWLQQVRQRPVPAASNHPWHYRLLKLDIDGEQAMAKINCPLPHGHFIDYLGLLREEGKWLIVNKMYAVREEV